MEEAATPLPKEETTPPVTNIYFGAIRVVRAATTAALDCSYLSGARLDAPRVSEFEPQILSTMTTYTQLWARFAALSIATLAVCKCKFLILAETFSLQKGSNFREGPEATLTVPAQAIFLGGTGAARSPSNSEKFLIFRFQPCIWRRVEISGSPLRNPEIAVAGLFSDPALAKVELGAHRSGSLG